MRIVWLLVGLVALAASRAAAADPVAVALRIEGSLAVVEMTIAAGWHVNAHDPDDRFLVPTTLAMTPPAGMRAGEVRYPPSV